MDSFIAKLAGVVVPPNYRDRFLDATSDEHALSVEERANIYRIMLYHYRASNPPKRKAAWCFGGESLTKRNTGYRIELDRLPQAVVHDIMAYVYILIG